MYADDLVVFCPCSLGLQQLLNVCTKFGLDNDIKYNAVKGYVMVVRTKEDSKLIFPDFSLTGSVLNSSNMVKYLGHYISNDLTDDRDIHRQLCKLYAQSNMLVSKFNMCSADVKVTLSKSFLSPMYTAQLWRSYKKSSLQKLIVAYNDSMRLLLRIPRHSSASQMFANCGVRSCSAALSHVCYRFMCRIMNSPNAIVHALVCPKISSVRFTSKMLSHWRACLYTMRN